MILALIGCANMPVSAAPEPPGPPPPKLEGAWRLALLNNRPVTAEARLQIDEVKTEGRTSCGAFVSEGGNAGVELTFEAMQPTENLQCDETAAKADEAVRATLAATSEIRIKQGYLVLMNEYGREIAYFAPVR